MQRLALTALALFSMSMVLAPIGCGAKQITEPPAEEEGDPNENEGDETEGSDEETGGSSSGKGGASNAKGGASGGKGGASTGKGGGSTGKGGASAGKGGSSSGKGGSSTGKGGSSASKGGNSNTGTSSCSKSGAWQTSDQYGLSPFDEYVIRNNYWNQGKPGAGTQSIWAISSRCWGVDAQHQDSAPKGTVKSYPDIARGWTISTPGSNGLAIQVSALTKAKIHWSMQAPTTGRTWALWDIYLHETNSPSADKAPVNLMIQQRIVDQDGWMQSDSKDWKKVTFDGITFREKLETSSVSSTRNRIQLYVDVVDGDVLGIDSMTLDLKAVIDHYVEGGQIKSSDYLTSIQAGYEIVSGGTYVTTDFWTALNNESEPK